MEVSFYQFIGAVFLFHSKNRPLAATSNYTINGQTLAVELSYKGVQMSNTLLRESHYAQISAKALRTFGLLRHTFSKANSINANRLLYFL